VGDLSEVEFGCFGRGGAAGADHEEEGFVFDAEGGFLAGAAGAAGDERGLGAGGVATGTFGLFGGDWSAFY